MSFQSSAHILLISKEDITAYWMVNIILSYVDFVSGTIRCRTFLACSARIKPPNRRSDHEIDKKKSHPSKKQCGFDHHREGCRVWLRPFFIVVSHYMPLIGKMKNQNRLIRLFYRSGLNLSNLVVTYPSERHHQKGRRGIDKYSALIAESRII